MTASRPSRPVAAGGSRGNPAKIRAPATREGVLTPRESGIAALVSEGKSNRAIAEELVLSERTVETHVSNILSKLDFSSRAQIAAWAVETRLSGSR